LTDDLALLELRNGADIPEFKSKDERWVAGQGSLYLIFLIPWDWKVTFHGEYMAPRFPVFPMDILHDYLNG